MMIRLGRSNRHGPMVLANEETMRKANRLDITNVTSQNGYLGFGRAQGKMASFDDLT
jgi:hypothetical protein